MVAREALKKAADAKAGERLRYFETICRPHDGCQREALEEDPGRWTWCPDCLTVFDDYGKAVNPIPELKKIH